MKGLKRENNLHLRISKQEKQKYNAIAHKKGLLFNEYLNIVLLNKIL